MALKPETTLSELGLTDQEQRAVLEWFGAKLAAIIEGGLGESICSKVYDPLTIEGNVAYSYAFDFEDGGRHHSFIDFAHLEKMLVNEGINRIQEALEG